MPDDQDARLVVLPAEHTFTKDGTSAAEVVAKALLESRGNSPRIFRNSLVFLAADKARMQDLDEAVHRYLAWKSIVDEAEVLDLGKHQRGQAETQLNAAEGRRLDSWTPASAEQQCAQSHSLLVVHPHHLDGRASRGRQASNGSIRPSGEMFLPRLPPGVIERHDEVGLGVDGRDIRPLLQVAANAAQAQIVGIVRSAVLPSDDVVNLMGQNRRVLGKTAVLTRGVRTSLDQVPRVARKPHEAARTVQNSSA